MKQMNKKIKRIIAIGFILFVFHTLGMIFISVPWPYDLIPAACYAYLMWKILHLKLLYSDIEGETDEKGNN